MVAVELSLKKVIFPQSSDSACDSDRYLNSSLIFFSALVYWVGCFVTPKLAYYWLIKAVDSVGIMIQRKTGNNLIYPTATWRKWYLSNTFYWCFVPQSFSVNVYPLSHSVFLKVHCQRYWRALQHWEISSSWGWLVAGKYVSFSLIHVTQSRLNKCETRSVKFQEYLPKGTITVKQVSRIYSLNFFSYIQRRSNRIFTALAK